MHPVRVSVCVPIYVCVYASCASISVCPIYVCVCLLCPSMHPVRVSHTYIWCGTCPSTHPDVCVCVCYVQVCILCEYIGTVVCILGQCVSLYMCVCVCYVQVYPVRVSVHTLYVCVCLYSKYASCGVCVCPYIGCVFDTRTVCILGVSVCGHYI